jgi:hypothetical protein
MNHILRRTTAILIVVGTGDGAVMGQLAIPWFTIANGGATSADGGYELSGTIGQADATAAGALTGGGYALTDGFWAVTGPACTTFAPADFDQDCDVDLNDFQLFTACAMGAGVPYNPVSLPAGCTLAVNGVILAADFDSDGDVDHDDFGTFQLCYSGAGGPADPACAE